MQWNQHAQRWEDAEHRLCYQPEWHVIHSDKHNWGLIHVTDSATRFVCDNDRVINAVGALLNSHQIMSLAARCITHTVIL